MKHRTKVLIIDANKTQRDATAFELRMHDYDVIEAGSGEKGIEVAVGLRPGLIMLDVDLPDMDGRSACRIMRRRNVTSPILFVTERTTDPDIILGLESGANDYIARPIRFNVLLARAQTHLKFHGQTFSAAFRLGPYEFRPSSKVLIDNNHRRIRLTVKETDILAYLLQAEGRMVRREELLAEVWGYNTGVNTHTLETHMYRLRQKIEPNPRSMRFLVTEEGGYSLKA